MMAEETLAEITLPAEAVPATIYSGQNHYTIPPGSSGRWEPSSFSPTCCTGPRLNYVLEGTYTVRGDGPMQVLRSGAAQWEDVPAGTEICWSPEMPCSRGWTTASTRSTPVRPRWSCWMGFSSMGK